MAEPLTRRITLLSNPASGTNRRAGLEAIDRLASQSGIAHHQASTPEAIEAALLLMAGDPPDIIAINGGDGTVDLVTHVMRSRDLFAQEPALALLRGGTTNMIHGDCGFSGKPAEALQALIDARGPVIERRPLEIHHTEAIPVYGFFLGAAAIPRAILATRATLHRRHMTGALGEALAMTAILARLRLRPDLQKDALLKPVPLSWQADGQDMSGPHVFVAVTSLQRLILRRRITAPAGMMGILSMGTDRRLRQTAASIVTLKSDEPWMLDGEMFPAASLDIRLGAPLRFITGRPA